MIKSLIDPSKIFLWTIVHILIGIIKPIFIDMSTMTILKEED